MYTHTEGKRRKFKAFLQPLGTVGVGDHDDGGVRLTFV
jgi:hypothetical protein